MHTGAKSHDKLFAILSGALVIAGLFILTSASLGLSIARFQTPYYFLIHQVAVGLIPGIILFWFTYHIDYHRWRVFALPLLLFSLVLVSLVFVPGLGLSHGGARRWLILGPVSFQPAELLKFAYIVYLAAWLEGRTKQLNSFTLGALPFLLMNAFVGFFIIRQPDMGTLMVLFIAAGGLFLISGASLRNSVFLICLAVILLGIVAIVEPYRLDRIKVFLDPMRDPQGSGYQVRQALIAVGSGGIWGKGFALSDQKYSYLPEPIGDSIFAIVAEEVGFVGASAIVFLFLLFYLRGSAIVKKAPDRFGYFLGMGILLLITAQALINISAIIGLIPLTGIPLSFVSYGGSALFITLAELGIIFNISRHI
jgi:cell division protein FtsW